LPNLVKKLNINQNILRPYVEACNINVQWVISWSH